MALHRFYWLLDGDLAGCSRPGLAHQRHWPEEDHDIVQARLDGDLRWLRSQGIGAVLSLTETSLDEAVVKGHGLEVLHMPIPDMTAPLPNQLMAGLDFIDVQRSAGRAVVVHCLQGQGRTGCVLAAYLIRSGIDAERAIERLRAVCGGAIGAPEQEAALHAFAVRRDWVL